MNILDLPFNRLIGLAESARPGAVLSLPNHPHYTNHLGTVHAGALMALAEATSGAYLITVLTDIGFEVLPVVRRAEVKFRRPALNGVDSSVFVSDGAKTEFITSLREKGRSLLGIQVNIHDEHGTHALIGNFEWFVARK